MRSPIVPDLFFRRTLFAVMAFAALAGAACERSASIGTLGRPDAAAPSADELCTTSGGDVSTATCCASVVAFPDTCSVGACGCAPASSHAVTVCACSAGCFMVGEGCAGASDVCTIGVDLSCNQDSAATAPRGRCVTGGRCVCAAGASLSGTGKCL